MTDSLNPKATTAHFAQRIVSWQRQHGRQHLPWQHHADPYKVWLSEIMLQQTQVSTVLSYYERFLERFPTVLALAKASQDEVMPYWAGLGYYARARNLHRCAQVVVNEYQGQFPRSSEQLATLPGIGPSTASAIAAFCFGERSPIMDGNVKRVFTRYFGIYGHPQKRAVDQTLWALARDVVAQSPADLNMAAYTQGQMDLGSMVCTRSKPRCGDCPLQTDCFALLHQKTHELPTPKPKAIQPERHCEMLILEWGHAILLEQRPDSGIWGGLWTLPQYDDTAALTLACQQLGAPLRSKQKMASLLHVFSHFKLHINPWHVRPSPMQRRPEPAATQQWVALTDLAQTALPAPVRKLIDGLYAHYVTGVRDDSDTPTSTNHTLPLALAEPSPHNS